MLDNAHVANCHARQTFNGKCKAGRRKEGDNKDTLGKYADKFWFRFVVSWSKTGGMDRDTDRERV